MLLMPLVSFGLGQATDEPEDPRWKMLTASEHGADLIEAIHERSARG